MYDDEDDFPEPKDDDVHSDDWGNDEEDTTYNGTENDDTPD